MPTLIAVMALVPLILVLLALAWVHARRDDDPEWRR